MVHFDINLMESTMRYSLWSSTNKDTHQVRSTQHYHRITKKYKTRIEHEPCDIAVQQSV